MLEKAISFDQSVCYALMFAKKALHRPRPGGSWSWHVGDVVDFFIDDRDREKKIIAHWISFCVFIRGARNYITCVLNYYDNELDVGELEIKFPGSNKDFHVWKFECVVWNKEVFVRAEA